MSFIADLHIHSRFSMATSKKLIPEYLDYWSAIKGISVLGTGDFTHPEWLKLLEEKLLPAEEGLFTIKPELKLNNPFAFKNDVRFLLSAEISNIYKKNGKTRKIHSVLLCSGFELARKLNQKLEKSGFNIRSDGRPILGLDVKDLLEICLETASSIGKIAGQDIFFIPAHIWTPWFSILGSKSGFDSPQECFEDLETYIYAVETGLSTDAPLNWICSFLDKYTLLSNSDAHSPEKLGRNANIFNCQQSYPAIIQAMMNPDQDEFQATVDLYPQEGKYHYDGHRKCGIVFDPLQSLQHNNLCPICGKKLTLGVVNRIAQLSDRASLIERNNRKDFYSIIPLKEILSEIEGCGPNTKKVTRAYEKYIQSLGSELDLLLKKPLEIIKRKGDILLAEAIRRMRNREIKIQTGFDGQFGVIKLFKEDELRSFSDNPSLLERSFSYQVKAGSVSKTQNSRNDFLDFDLEEYSRLKGF